MGARDVWAAHCWSAGSEVRELLDTSAQLELHLQACERFPSRLRLFRFHPDTWTCEELEHEPLTRLWSAGRWADCLSLHCADAETAWVTYQREAGDEGLLLFNSARSQQPRSVPTGDGEAWVAGWHTLEFGPALALVRGFAGQGRLPEAPEGCWWMDHDERRVDLGGLWSEQNAAWAERRQRFLAELRPRNERARGYGQEFDGGRRVCPLCRAAGQVRLLDGGLSSFSGFTCQACGRSFGVEEVDRTPQSRVE